MDGISSSFLVAGAGGTGQDMGRLPKGTVLIFKWPQNAPECWSKAGAPKSSLK